MNQNELNADGCVSVPAQCKRGFHNRAILLINQYRADNGADPITADPLLTAQANAYAYHVCDISFEQFWSETQPDNVSIAFLGDDTVPGSVALSLTEDYCAGIR